MMNHHTKAPPNVLAHLNPVTVTGIERAFLATRNLPLDRSQLPIVYRAIFGAMRQLPANVAERDQLAKKVFDHLLVIGSFELDGEALLLFSPSQIQVSSADTLKRNIADRISRTCCSQGLA